MNKFFKVNVNVEYEVNENTLHEDIIFVVRATAAKEAAEYANNLVPRKWGTNMVHHSVDEVKEISQLDFQLEWAWAF